jgi:MFS family permease
VEATEPIRSRFASLGALSYPAYRRIWLGAFISNLGTWIQSISIGVYVTQTTGKAGWTGTIAALTFLPSVVLSPIGGALADRRDRRRLVGLLATIQALCAAGLAALGLSESLSLFAIAALVFIAGCATAMSMPAFNALLMEIVGPAHILSAVSLSAAQFNLARIIGPMIAAAILAFGGFGFAFVANALATFAVVAAVLTTKTARRPRAVDGSLLQGLAQGFRIARVDPGIRLALPLVLTVSVLIAPFIGLMPVYAINGFERGAAGASMLATSQGLGALIAAFFANAVATRWGVRNLLKRALFIVAPIAGAYWLSPTFEIAMLSVVLLGGAYMWTLSALSTTCLARVSRDIQARTSSLYSMTLSAGYSVGLVAQGWLTDQLGLRTPAAAAALLLVILLVLAQRRAFDAVEAPCRFGGTIATRGPSVCGPAVSDTDAAQVRLAG